MLEYRYIERGLLALSPGGLGTLTVLERLDCIGIGANMGDLLAHPALLICTCLLSHPYKPVFAKT